MTKLTALMMLALVAGWVGLAAQEAEEHLVDEALLALPEQMRDGAAVVRFEDGKQVFLREGSNGMFCRADDPDVSGIAVWCYPQTHDAYARRWYQLEAEGHAPGELNEMITEEIASGTLKWPEVAVNYNLRGTEPRQRLAEHRRLHSVRHRRVARDH